MKNPEQGGKAAAQSAAAPPSDYENRALVPAEFALWEKFAEQPPTLQPFIWEGFLGRVRYTCKQAICDHFQRQCIRHWRSPNPG